VEPGRCCIGSGVMLLHWFSVRPLGIWGFGFWCRSKQRHWRRRLIWVGLWVSLGEGWTVIREVQRWGVLWSRLGRN